MSFTLEGDLACQSDTRLVGQHPDGAGEGVPLLDTELGVDAGAWRDGSYDSFFYATREVEMYQDVILHARLRAIRTSQTDRFHELPAFQPHDGVLELQLAPQSLVTLTTITAQRGRDS